MGHKILVTGAGGYIGSINTYYLLQKGYEIVAIDNFSTGYRKPLEVLQEKFGEDKLRFYEVNILDDFSKLLEKEKGIEAVIHFAASCLVNESMENPQKYFTNNVCGTQNLLVVLMKNDIKKIVFSSTCAVNGNPEYLPIDENHPIDPASVYGQTKRMMEEMVQWYGKTADLKYVIFRYFNVCGASDDGLIGDSKKPSQLLMQNAVRGALGIEPFYLTCPEVDTPDKTPIRDYINVVDLADAHYKALEYIIDGGENELINIGTGTGNSVLEIVEKVQEITGKKFDLKKGEARKGEATKMIAGVKKAKEILDWEPKHTLEDSVNSLIKWYTDHPHGW